MFTGNLVIKVHETKRNRDFFPTSRFQKISLGGKITSGSFRFDRHTMQNFLGRTSLNFLGDLGLLNPDT